MQLERRVEEEKRAHLRSLARQGFADPSSIMPEEIQELCAAVIAALDQEDDIILQSRFPKSKE